MQGNSGDKLPSSVGEGVRGQEINCLVLMLFASAGTPRPCDCLKVQEGELVARHSDMSGQVAICRSMASSVQELAWDCLYLALYL